jgi:uncharacterized coiled-coil protein SlyX
VKQWIEASKAIATKVYSVKTKVDSDIDEITEKCSDSITEAEEAIQRTLESIKKINQVVIDQQLLIKQQRDEISMKTIRIFDLESSLHDTTEKLEFLTENAKAVTESLCAPMREQVTEAMFSMMKEKVITIIIDVLCLSYLFSFIYYMHIKAFCIIKHVLYIHTYNAYLYIIFIIFIR